MKLVQNGYLLFVVWIIFGTIIFFPIYYVYDKFDFVVLPKPRTTNTTKIDNNIKYVLYWIPMWDSKTFYFGSIGFELFKHCEINSCFATHNRQLIPINEFNAIVFHAPEYMVEVDGKPLSRDIRQRYIFASMEAPIPGEQFYNGCNSFYNWTMTYRTDSDIIMPYGFIIKNRTDYVMPTMEFVKNKTNLAAWLVSHCITHSGRETLVRNLQNYIKIDIYGKCGNITLSEWEYKKFIEEKYKFYLAFENAYCKDYATEKLYNYLELNIVPVVYGGADYEKFAPPNSVIVADKFESAKHLAGYLLFLDQNPKEYLKYFEWKKDYRIDIYKNHTVCQLCKMLHDPLEPPKIYENIQLWWEGKYSNNCKSAIVQIFNIIN